MLRVLIFRAQFLTRCAGKGQEPGNTQRKAPSDVALDANIILLLWSLTLCCLSTSPARISVLNLGLILNFLETDIQGAACTLPEIRLQIA